jgi:hypothetical protein
VSCVSQSVSPTQHLTSLTINRSTNNTMYSASHIGRKLKLSESFSKTDPNPVHPDVLLGDTDDNSCHPTILDSLAAESIRAAALHTQQGAAEPSGLDALSWRQPCTAFEQKSNDLCTALAKVARRISTTFIDPSTLLAYTSCRLIPLDRCP